MNHKRVITILLTLAITTTAVLAAPHAPTGGGGVLGPTGDGVPHHVDRAPAAAAGGVITSTSYVVKASIGQIDTFLRTSATYHQRPGVCAAAGTSTPTPTPYLKAHVQNPEGTPIPSDLNWYSWYPVEFVDVCTDCISYTIPYTYQGEGVYAGAWVEGLSITSTVLGATPDPGGGWPGGSLTGYGYSWPSWPTGRRAVTFTVATVTPTPTPSPTPSTTPTPTPTPTPYLRVEARNPQGTPVIVSELGHVNTSGSSHCNNCDSFTDWIISTQIGGMFRDDQYLGDAYSLDVALGDLDGDGDLDAVVANIDTNNRIWLNDGNGGFTAGATLGNDGSVSVELADLDGINGPDVFFGNLAGNTVYLNDGNGNLIATGQSLGSAWTKGTATGDVDNDGDLDIFAANNGVTDTVWLNDGAGNFTAQPLTMMGDSDGVDLGDLDGDLDLDAVIAFEHGSAVLLNDGLGNFADTGQTLGGLEEGGNSVVLGDVDGDLDLDAYIVGESTSVPGRIWLNDGAGQFSPGQIVGYSNSIGRLGDVDNDGDLDIFNTHPIHNQVYLNNGGTYALNQELSSDSLNQRGLALGDLDSDGDLDVFAAAHGPNVVWRNVYGGAYMIPYSNQVILGVTPEPPGVLYDETHYFWDHRWNTGEHSAIFIVATPTATPLPESAYLTINVTDPQGVPLRTSQLSVHGLPMGVDHDGQCEMCTDCDNLTVDIAMHPFYTSFYVSIVTYGQDVIGLVADPDTGTTSPSGRSYTWDRWTSGTHYITFIVALPPTPVPISTPAPSEFFPLGAPSMDFLNLPTTLNLPSMPALDVVQLPATLDLPSMPQLAHPVFPQTLALPSMPQLVAPVFPQTLGLIMFVTPLTPTFPTTWTLPSEITPTKSLSAVTNGLLASFVPVTERASDIQTNVTGRVGDIETMQLANYTAAEMAAEMTTGMDTAFSYLRAAGSIGIIGPSAFAILIGLAWITFFSLAKLVVKSNLLLVDIAIRFMDIVSKFLS